MQQPPKNYLDDFDPNDMPEPYATYTYGRMPHFKLHRTLSAASGAMSNSKRAGIALYERQGGRWVLLARFEPHSFMPDRCDSCRLSAVQTDYRRQAPYNQAEQFLERVGGRGGKLVKPLNVLTLCPDCRRGLGYRGY